MPEKFKAPRGTFDVLPEQQPVRLRIETAAREKLEAAGYGRIDTPAFEETDLFARGVGESTDIVQKQMFTFEDQGGRSLTLRPMPANPWPSWNGLPRGARCASWSCAPRCIERGSAIPAA